MPSTKAHKEITKKFFGNKKDYDWVHALIDGTVSLKRSELSKTMPDLVDAHSHRKDSVHTLDFWITLYFMGRIDLETLKVAYLHMISDQIDTSTGKALDTFFNPSWKLDRLRAKYLGEQNYK